MGGMKNLNEDIIEEVQEFGGKSRSKVEAVRSAKPNNLKSAPPP